MKIENLDFTKIFEIYDKEDVFYFLDSPYKCDEQYGVGKFTDEHYYKLFECCKNSKGKWLYTINDHPFIRDLFREFNIIENKDVFYSLSVAATDDNFFNELIITNYEVKKYNYIANDLDNYFEFN